MVSSRLTVFGRRWKKGSIMRIGLFTDTYLPHMNGVATHVKTLKDGLEKIGHEVTVVTADPDASDYYLKEGVLHCPAVEIKRFYGNGMALPEMTSHWLESHGVRFDLVHVHTEFGIGISGAKMARRQGIPLIYTMHTMWEQYLHYIAPQPVLPIARKAERAYVRRFARKADEIIGPSPRVQGVLDAYGISRKINVIPNAVELDYFSRENADAAIVSRIKEEHGIREEDVVICFCGRLGKEKSVDELLEHFAASHGTDDHLKLMVAGDGPMGVELRQQAKDLGLGEAVIFTGSVPHEQMREIYACCDLYATASRSEVNSISMLEAMAMGLPILHVVDEGNPGQITEGVNGYLFRTTEEFQEAICRFRDDPKERERLCASTVRSVHDAGQEGLARQVEAVYQRAFAQKKTV